MAGPRYTTVDGDSVSIYGMERCLDCGSLIYTPDKAAHTRFHSILSAHAWTLAILKNRAPADVQERIDSKRFDSWSADALAEVVKGHDGDPG